MHRYIWRGFRFGALLQIAVGPVCLFIFQTAASSGFFAAEAAVLAVTLADSLYVAAPLSGQGRSQKRTAGPKHIQVPWRGSYHSLWDIFDTRSLRREHPPGYRGNDRDKF